MTGRTLYPCCQCCTPADYRDLLYAPGGCEVPDRHTVPCLMCGQKVQPPPDEEFLAHHPEWKT